MKIYILTDLEGVSGIDSIELMKREDPRYRFSVERLMMDVNAAVDGAFAGGATHVTVVDGHMGGGNFDVSLLDKRAELDVMEQDQWWGRLDNTYAGAFSIGAHAMAGTINGFLDHTQDSSQWYNYWINGRKMGELAQWGIICGSFGVPVLMVSGDEAACTEAYEFFDLIECAAVKRGQGRNRAILADPGEAVERIREAARRAMSLVGKAKPLTPILPLEIKLELYRSDYCDEAAQRPGVERLDARTIRKVTNSCRDLLF